MKNLDWKKTILTSSIIIAVAIVAAAFSPATSQSRGSSFMLAGDSGQFIWRVNVTTGAVSYCVRRDNSLDQKLMSQRAPYCSAQSPAVQ